MHLEIGLLAISHKTSVHIAQAIFRTRAVIERYRILTVGSEITVTDLAANVWPHSRVGKSGTAVRYA